MNPVGGPVVGGDTVLFLFSRVMDVKGKVFTKQKSDSRHMGPLSRKEYRSPLEVAEGRGESLKLFGIGSYSLKSLR